MGWINSFIKYSGNVDKAKPITKDRNQIFRVLVIFCLVGTVVVAAYFPYTLFKNFEDEKTKKEFRTIAKHSDSTLNKVISDKFVVLDTGLVGLVGRCPTSSHWPHCVRDPQEFENSFNVIRELSGASAYTVAAVVYPNETAELEAYVNDVYLGAGVDSFGGWGYPNSTTRGIWAYDSFGKPSHRVNSSEGFLVPVVNLAVVFNNERSLGSSLILFDLLGDSIRRSATLKLMACVQESDDGKCAILSDLIMPIADFPSEVYSFTMRPIIIQGDVVGFVTCAFPWVHTISQLFPEYVNGIDVVVESPTDAYTFHVTDGAATSTKKGDHHDSKYHDTRYTFLLDSIYTNVEYRVSLYASSEYYSSEDHRAIYASVIAVSIALSTSFFFLLYDFFQSRTARETELILNTKRDFVRYISHEIRTPLNTVSVGLKVLYQELLAKSETSFIRGADCDNGLIGINDEETERVSTVLNTSGDKKTVSDSRGLSRPTPSREDMLVLVTEIEESACTAVDILNDLIDYDKVCRGNVQLQVEAIPVRRFLSGAIAAFMIQGRQKNITLTQDIDDSVFMNSLFVLGDVSKLNQVMRNLLSNALKFTHVGGCVSISAFWDARPDQQSSLSLMAEEESLVYSGGRVVIRVKDNGAGISPANQKLLFQEGVQFNAKELQAGKGSGLGLFITKGFVDLHFGDISAQSEGEGYGCTFTLELPALSYKNNEALIPPERSGCCLSTVEADDSASISSSNSRPMHTDIETGVSIDQPDYLLSLSSTQNLRVEGVLSDISPSPTEEQKQYEMVRASSTAAKNAIGGDTRLQSTKDIKNILAVDDSTPTRKMVCRLLTNAGYVCSQAEDGEECVQFMIKNREAPEAEKIDMILMDYEMPVMNGPTTCKTLRDMAFTVPIIGVTGNVLPADEAYFISQGADRVLAKPLQVTKLNGIIEEFSLSKS